MKKGAFGTPFGLRRRRVRVNGDRSHGRSHAARPPAMTARAPVTGPPVIARSAPQPDPRRPDIGGTGCHRHHLIACRWRRAIGGVAVTGIHRRHHAAAQQRGAAQQCRSQRTAQGVIQQGGHGHSFHTVPAGLQAETLGSGTQSRSRSVHGGDFQNAPCPCARPVPAGVLVQVTPPGAAVGAHLGAEPVVLDAGDRGALPIPVAAPEPGPLQAPDEAVESAAAPAEAGDAAAAENPAAMATARPIPVVPAAEAAAAGLETRARWGWNAPARPCRLPPQRCAVRRLPAPRAPVVAAASPEPVPAHPDIVRVRRHRAVFHTGWRGRAVLGVDHGAGVVIARAAVPTVHRRYHTASQCGSADGSHQNRQHPACGPCRMAGRASSRGNNGLSHTVAPVDTPITNNPGHMLTGVVIWGVKRG
jgi:hypothetical protein